MPYLLGKKKGIAVALLVAWGSSAHAETAVIRSTYENTLMPLAASNRVVGVAANVGGNNLYAGNWPSVVNNPQFIVAEVQVGAPCGAIVANYGIGDVLDAPDGVADGAVPNISAADNVFWIDYADMLLAVDSGAAVVQWEMADGTINTMTYAISSNPKERPVRLYWTDDENGKPLQNAGPTIQFGQNYRVDLFPSSSVSINTNNYQWSYSGSEAPPNDVWLDGSYLHAKEDVAGKFLLTYSRLNEDGFRQYLGHEVVEVLAPMSEKQEVSVGDRLTPMKRKYDIADLFSTISRGATDPTGENPDNIFVYKHNQGAKNGWIWAVRETEAAWQVEIYWKAKEKLDVIWPFEVDIYSISWGDDLQQYVRGDLDAGDYDPLVYIPSELSASVMPYQTLAGGTGESDAFAFVEDGVLHTEELGKFLLRYSTEDTVWFEPVEAAAHEAVAIDVGVWDIASRIEPASADYTNWPGYLYAPSGTAYNPNYYSYPDAYQDSEDITSSIYGVNQGELEVWWANASKFWTMTDVDEEEIKLPNPVSFPSLVNVYSNVWPAAADQIVVASGLGSSGLTAELGNSFVVSCDGTGYSVADEPELGSWEADEAFTLEAWIKPMQLSGTIFAKGSEWSFGFADGEPVLICGEETLYSGASLQTNCWQHLAVCRESNGTTRFFLNGEKVRVTTCTNAFTSSSALSYGAFEGVLDEVRVWNVARSDEKIRQAMRRPLVASDPVPAFYESFDDPGSALCTFAVPSDASKEVSLSVDMPLWTEQSFSIVAGADDDYGDGGFTDGNYLRTTKGSCTMTLSLTDLPEHDSLALGMHVAQIGSLDPNRDGDVFSITVDGEEVFYVGLGFGDYSIYHESAIQFFRLFGESATNALLEAARTLTLDKTFDEHVYDLSQLDALQHIPHSGGSAVITITAIADQGWSGEGYGLDNLSLVFMQGSETDDAEEYVMSLDGEQFNVGGRPAVHSSLNLAGASPEIYNQDDETAPGYNPNEEHALMVQDSVFALRSDLNQTDSSEYTSDPFVLVEYTDADGNPEMTIYEVLVTNELYVFEQFLDAGQMIQVPAPLNQMVPTWCAQNGFVGGAFDPFEDRTGRFWAQQAGDDGSSAEVVAHLWYPSQSGFWYPDNDSYSVGDEVPLSADGGTEPVDFTYVVSWPEAVPGLYVGDTLTSAKNGLPAVRGQLSVDVVYQQSELLSSQPSVKLIDPTCARKVGMDEVPSGMKTYRDPKTSYTFFSELPPSLRSRMYWNGTASDDEEFQLVGEYVERTDGNNYLLLNTLSQSNRVNALDSDKVTGQDEVWIQAINTMPSEVVEITDDETPVDSYALSTVGRGCGYVTLIFNDSTDTDRVDSSEVVDMAIIKVEPELYQGALDTLLSDNPLDKQLTLKYTADFAGEPEQFEFEWNYADPDNGSAPDEESGNWKYFAKQDGLHYVMVGDAGVFGLSDHYLRCRYRALDPGVTNIVGSEWSSWTDPQLTEGWVKRAMKAINPFEQRITDYMNYALDTSLSMIQQAGAPYDGDVPLNYDALDDYGLIQIYETIYRQALDLCANSDVDGALSLALMMVSGRLADLYTLLGNEAYADALNPTVTLGSDDPAECMALTSIFCFQNQLPDLLSEELALLRGRDGSMSPAVTEYPLFNRLTWNFTADIVGGEVAYALNYGISDLKGNQDGSVDEDDAAILFPQGHGDAWGHYLKALKYYYAMMHADNFNWYPQVEGLLVGDTEVTVSYLHEKKFAVAAAAKAKAGLDILNKTWRQDYETGEDQADGYYDSDADRAWGVSEWASRSGQGAYFDWLAANSLLPDQEADPEVEGIRIIDRATVPELDEIAEAGRKVQQQLDQIDSGMNPLGLAENVVPFDISSAGIDAGETHFEQIYDRAEAALQNTAKIFDRVQTCAQALRDQNEDRTFDETYADEEAELNRRLIEIYGYPYSDDIGPGKTYAQDYIGPDLVHYDYIEQYVKNDYSQKSITVISTNYTVTGYESVEQNVDLPASLYVEANLTAGFLALATVFDVDKPVMEATYVTNTFFVGSSGIPSKPADYTGSRRAEGEIQIVLSSFIEALNRLSAVVEENEELSIEAESLAELIYTEHSYETIAGIYGAETEATIQGVKALRDYLKSVRTNASSAADDLWRVQTAIAEAAPTAVGMSVDAGSSLRMLAAATGGGEMIAKRTVATSLTLAEKVLLGVDIALTATKSAVTGALNKAQLHEERLTELKNLVLQERSCLNELYQAAQAAETARMEYMKAIADGDALQVERERLRTNHASDLQAKRYRNMAYMIMRNDELDRYSESFNQAARYCYLAAKAYDYETGLLASESAETTGSEFLEDIVKARTIGRMSRGSGNAPETPLVGAATGDPGLADILARMKANWEVLDGRLSFNNPQTETGQFSLRQELFRIKPASTNSESSDENWRDTLESYRVDNLLDLPEFKRYCLPFTPADAEEPALVIPFSTDVNFGNNFFGLSLAGGDNAYDSTHFATKIRSVGVWFSNFDNAFEGGLANQPRVYLIPVGVDRMRVPSKDMEEIRSFHVVDQALPVPYPFSEQDWESSDWSALKDLLGNELYNTRRYPSMRAYHDSGDFDSTEVVNNSRLIGRSVWNTKWLLIIPGGTLLDDGEEGLDRFIHGREVYPDVRNENGVTDIKIFFQTYSYSGN